METQIQNHNTNLYGKNQVARNNGPFNKTNIVGAKLRDTWPNLFCATISVLKRAQSCQTVSSHHGNSDGESECAAGIAAQLGKLLDQQQQSPRTGWNKLIPPVSFRLQNGARDLLEGL
eukprot:565931-Amphidinium_carterae.1